MPARLHLPPQEKISGPNLWRGGSLRTVSGLEIREWANHFCERDFRIRRHNLWELKPGSFCDIAGRKIEVARTIWRTVVRSDGNHWDSVRRGDARFGLRSVA